MNLVKWLRKNNKKIMAVVVIVIMIGFVGGTALQQLLRRRSGGSKTVGYFGEASKITGTHINSAYRELEILRMIRADDTLRSIVDPIFRVPDFRASMLAELLFYDRQRSPLVNERLKKIIGQGQYRISEEQLSEIYRAPMPPRLYWLLLEKEASLSGMRVSPEDARLHMATVLPKLTEGGTYSQVVSAVMANLKISEERLVSTYGKLLGVLDYARIVCSTENVTINQIMNDVSFDEERIDAEVVKFDSSVFADSQAEPEEQAIGEQFDKYKSFFRGQVTEENPYGFGYKLSDSVELEYIAIKLDDVSEIVSKPTAQEMEEYYSNNRNQFTRSVPVDPNDPNSPTVDEIKSYSEVAGIIAQRLLQQRINLKADEIIQTAKSETDPILDESEPNRLSDEQFKALAGDYTGTAEQLSQDNGIAVYSGRTGLLNVDDMRMDANLAALAVTGYGYRPIPLTQIVFSLDAFGGGGMSSTLEMPKMRLYENIGPTRDMYGQIMALVRVVKAQPATVAESANETFSKAGIKLDSNPGQSDEDLYSVREKVVEDLKRLAAMQTAKAEAEKFKAMATGEEGWDAAINEFNRQYGPDQNDANVADANVGNAIVGDTNVGDANVGDANVGDANTVGPELPEKIEGPFELQELEQLRRISDEALGTLAFQMAGSPGLQSSIDMFTKQSQFIRELFSLIPAGADSLEDVPTVLEFKPEMSYFVLKSLSVNRVNQSQYERIKGIQVYREELAQSQSMAVVHFNPENIVKRMNFRWAEQPGKKAEANETAEANEGAEAEGKP